MAEEGDGARALGEAIADELERDFKDAASDIGGLVLQRVRDGRTSKYKAEEWARLYGRPPFVGRPEGVDLDPMRCRHWSLGMMTAWVLWRSFDMVRDEWDEYCANWIVWHEVGPPQVRVVRAARPEDTLAPPCGHEPGPREPNTPNGVVTGARTRLSMGGSPELVLGVEEAKREILDALRQVPPVKDPPLVALHGNRREPIAAEAWDALSPFDPHDRVFHLDGKRVPLSGLRVDRDAVLALWPAKGAEPVVEDAPAPAGAPIDAGLVEAEAEPAVEAAAMAGPAGEEKSTERDTATVQGAEARAAKSSHAQRRVAYMHEKVPDLDKRGARLALRRHSDEYQKQHRKEPVGRTQHGKDVRALRSLQK